MKTAKAVFAILTITMSMVGRVCSQWILPLLFLSAPPSALQAQFTFGTVNGAYIEITKYTGSASSVIIPSTLDNLPVVEIGEYQEGYIDGQPQLYGAFENCILTSVTIPDSVRTIDENAFCNCYTLSNVTIGNSVGSIGSDAFLLCTNLTSLAIPDSVMQIGWDTFAQCSHLTSVVIGNGVTNIGEWAFQLCISLTNVTIGDSVTTIEPYAFQLCGSLTSVTIPNSVTSIGESAFDNCTNLTRITIGNNVVFWGGGAFGNCLALTNVTLAYGLGSIGTAAFSDCTRLTSVTIPDSVSNLEDAAFFGCSSLTSVAIPDNVTNIGDDAFDGCTRLTNAYFQGNAPTYGSSIFGLENNVTVYYFPGTTGWGTTFAGCPTMPWSLSPSRPATATVVVTNGFVVSTPITDPGNGYTNAPTVYFIGGGGAGAQATAAISNGVVIAIDIISPGSRYGTAPTIVCSPGVLPRLSILGATSLTFSNLTLGNTYQLQLVTSGSRTSVSAPFEATETAWSQYADVGAYELVALPIPYGATATPQVSYGFLVGATLASGGLGYATAPAVSIVGGTGSGAEATATISNGVVTAINIINPGSGYTIPPHIVIAPPAIPALLPTLTGAVRVDCSGLAANANYHLQTSPNLSDWSNYGTTFTSTTATNSQYLDSQTGMMFFRLQYVP